MKVSERHYLQLTDDFYVAASETSTDSAAVAVRNVVQPPAAIENAPAEAEATAPVNAVENCKSQQNRQVVRGRIELPTRGFSVRCSTN